MITHDEMLAELRLIYAERRDHLQVIRPKRSKEEIALKEMRLETLKAAGVEFARLIAGEKGKAA